MNLHTWARLLSRLGKEQKRPRQQRGQQRRLRLEELEDRVVPATDIWIGGTSSNHWSAAGNWSLSRAPATGDDLIFPQVSAGDRNAINDIAGDPAFNSITISGTGYTLSGLPSTPEIALTGALNVNANLGLETISLSLQLTPPLSTLQQTITVGGASTLDISGQLHDTNNGNGGLTGASQTLTKAGSGTLQLDGTNTTYSGAITIANSGGIIDITNAYALGTGTAISNAPLSGITTVNLNSQLQISNVASPIPENLKLNGAGIINDGALLNAAGANIWAGNVEMDADTTIGANANTSMNITGVISDLGAGHNLTKQGYGTIIFSHAGGDTYRGTTTIDNGVLSIQDPEALGNSPTHSSTTTVNYNTITGFGGTLQLDNELSTNVNGTSPGFVVSNESLILNGPGANNVATPFGALDNYNGNNTWTGPVSLGDAAPGDIAVNIGVDSVLISGAPTNLLISGVVRDLSGAAAPQLDKIGTGRLILTASNTYTGVTDVQDGFLNVEDSQALGASTKVNPKNTAKIVLPVIDVDNAAALELELQIDDIFGMIPKPANDSVTGKDYAMTFGSSGTTGAYYLQLTGSGYKHEGALNSITGVNNWTGTIDLNGTTYIGVDSDSAIPTSSAYPNASNSNAYFPNPPALPTQIGDYSLKASGVIENAGGADGVLVKVGPGQLIPTGDNTYGVVTFSTLDISTDIKAGWITIENPDALGTISPGITQPLQVYTEVEAGGALDILGTGFSINNNFILAGTGFSHPYSLINDAGALEDLDGNNTLTGIIQLNGNAGIGVEKVGLLTTPTPQLTITGTITDYTDPSGNVHSGGIIKVGSQRLIIQGQGTYTGPVDIRTGVLLDQYTTALGAGVNTTTVEAGASLEMGSTIASENGGIQAGVETWGENLVLNGTGDSAFGDTALTILTGDMANVGADPGVVPTGLLNDPLVNIDNIWRGNVTLDGNTTVTVQPDSRVIIAGNIGDNSVSGITLTGGGELDLDGDNTYRGTTYVNQGVLTVGNNSGLGAGGIGEVESLNFSGATNGVTQYTLSFDGYTTKNPITYTGVAFVDATAIQTALDSLYSIGGGGDAGGIVNVVSTGTGTFNVTFEGGLSGFVQPMIQYTFGGMNYQAGQVTAGAGGTIVTSGATLQLAGSISIGGEPVIVQGSGVSSAPDVPTQWFPVGPAPIDNGQTSVNLDGQTGNVAGRVTGVVSDPADPDVIYIATAGGGAWKTIDGGVTWRPMFDAIPIAQDVILNNLNGSTFTLTYEGQTTTALAANASAAQVQAALDALPNIGPVGGYVVVTLATPAPLNTPTYTVNFEGTLTGNSVGDISGTVTKPTATSAIGEVPLGEGLIANSPRFALYVGAITMDPQNSNTIYIGTGETNNSTDSFYGTGIYKSTDAGVTWSLVSGTEVQQVTVKGLEETAPGTFTLTYLGQTTPPLDIHSTTLQVQNALNALTTIKNVNSTVTVTGSNPTFGTPIAEEQYLAIQSTNGMFTLTFEGQTTAVLTETGTGATDAGTIQSALDALSTIGGVGGSVTVTYDANSPSSNENFFITFEGTPNLGFYTQPLITFGGVGTSPPIGTVTELIEGGVIYQILFNGVLSKTDVPIMTTIATGGGGPQSPVDDATSVVAITDPFNPFESKGISQIILTPLPKGGEDLYAASGDGGTGKNEVQTITFIGFPDPAAEDAPSQGDTNPQDGLPEADFSLSFTGADATGAVVTDTTSGPDNGLLIYYRNNETFTDPGTGITYTGPFATADEMQYYLDLLGNIGGIGGFVIVAYHKGGKRTPSDFTVTFEGQLSDTTVAVITTDWPLPNPNNSPPPPWINVQITTLGGPAKVINGTAYNAGIWRLQGGLWFNITDVVSVVRSTIPSTNSSDTIYGPTSNETVGIFPNTPGPDDDYRLTFPQDSTAGTTWSGVQYVNGVLFAALGTSQGPPSQINGTTVDPLDPNAVYWTADPTDADPIWYVGDPYNSSAVLVPDIESAAEFPEVLNGPFSAGNIKISAIFDPAQSETPEVANGYTSINPGFIAVYASVANPNGTLNGIYVSYDGGETWAATGSVPFTDYLSDEGAYDNAVLTTNGGNTVIAGGTASDIADESGQIYESNDGGTTWGDLSLDSQFNSPHTSAHALVLDAYGNLLVGNDGGIWRYSGGTWFDLNGNLEISQMNSVSFDPTSIGSAFGSVQSNGTVEFNNALNWAEVDDNAGGQMGGGAVYIDQNDPEIIDAVQLQLGNDAVVRQSTDGGVTWNTILQNPVIQSSVVPLVMDSVDPDRLLVGGGVNAGLFETFDQGASWTDISANLPNGFNVKGIALAAYQGTFAADPNFPLVTDQGSNSYDPDTIYVTDGIDIQVTKDGGQSWADVGYGGAGIVDLEVDPRNRDTVYAVSNTFGAAQIFESTDAGNDWTEIGASNDLPDVPAWKIVVDPRNGNLFVGDDLGVYELVGGAANAVSNGGTATWQRFGAGLPDVQAKDLVLNQTNDTLLAGTYGRSMYQLFLDSAETNNPPVLGALVGLSGASVWTGPVDLAANTVIGATGTQGLPNGLSAASLNILGSINDLTGNTTPTLTKTGGGNVIFTGDNIYGGLTVVAQGALVSNSDQALGLNNYPSIPLTTDGTEVDSGASLELSSNLDAEPVLLAGNGFSFDGHYQGALRNISGDNTFTGAVTLATTDPGTGAALTDSTIGADSGSQLTMTGAITGGSASFTLAKDGTGVVAFAGSDSYLGLTAVYSGALDLENSSAITDTKDGGAEVLDGAQMQLEDPSGNGTAPVTISVPLLLSGSGIFGTGALLSTAGDNTWSGAITFVSLPGFAPYTTPLGYVALSANTGATLNISKSISQTTAATGNVPTGLVIVAGTDGAGTVALQANDAYSGYTEVTAGNLEVESSNAIGSALGTRSGLLTSSTPAIQRITTVSSEQTGTFNISLGNALQTLNWGAPTTGAGSVQAAVTALLTANGYSSFTVNPPTRTAITTTTQNGSAGTTFGYLYTVTIVFTGTGNSAPGTDIELSAIGANGTTASASPVAIGGYETLVDNGAELQLANGITVSNRLLTLSGNGSADDGALHSISGNNTWSGTIDMTANSSFGADASSELTISGTLLVPNASTLTKVGAGTLIIPKGASETNQTQTIIEAGFVQDDGTLGTVLLDGGTISGNGLVGAITSSSSAAGTIDAGDHYPSEGVGFLTVSGTGAGSTAVNLQKSDNLAVDLDNPAAPNNNDYLYVKNGGISLGGAMLSGMVGQDPAVTIGTTFTIIQTDYAMHSNDVVTGEFAGVPTTAPAGAYAANIVYLYADNQKFVVDYYVDHVTITRSAVNFTVALSPSVTSPVYGEPDVFTATLTSESGAPYPTGTVVFAVTGPNGTNDYTEPISGSGSIGTATWDPYAATGLPLYEGNYSISIEANAYTGPDDVSNNPLFTPTNLPQTLNVTVNPAPVTVGLTSYWSPGTEPVYGQNITFTATVTSAQTPVIADALAPAGTITFMDGGTALATITLNSIPNTQQSVAVLNTDTLAVQLSATTHTIYAVYTPDLNPDNYAAPAMPTKITQQIDTDSTTITKFVSSDNPSVYGDPVTYSATIIANFPGIVPPTGTVTFSDNGVQIGTASLNPVTGIASYTTTPNNQLAAGPNQTITATYSGDSDFTMSSASLVQTVNKETTTTVVTSSSPVISNSPLVYGSYYGQAVTFTATVTSNNTNSNSGVPAGSVTFKDGFTVLGTLSAPISTTSNSETFALTTSATELPVGTDQSIIAVFNGDSNYVFSSASLTQTVNQEATTITVKTVTPSPDYGQRVTFTANVLSNDGNGVPTGTVTFVDTTATGSQQTLATITLNASDVATYVTGAFQLPVGVQTITANYNGDGNFLTSSTTGSQSQSVTVNEDPTTTLIQTSLDPAVYGEPVTFTATVSANTPGSGIPTGTVTFMDGSVVLGTATLSNAGSAATASYTTNAFQLPIGATQTITATYNSDGNYQTTQAQLIETVELDATTTSLGTSITPSVYGQAVTFSATVSANKPGSGTPTGTVTFKENGTTLGTATLMSSNGQQTASYTTTAPLPVGTNEPITAIYSGDSDFSSSTTVLSQTVQQDPTAISISPNPTTTLDYGQETTYTVTVSSTSPGAGIPSGTVTFVDGTANGSTVLGTATLSTSGSVATASFMTTGQELPVGMNQTITANYNGDTNFAVSTTNVSQTVIQDGTNVSVTSLTNPSTYGQAVTFTSTVSAAGLGSGIPTGTVNFYDGTTFLGSGTLNVAGGVATASYTTGGFQLFAGVGQTITATYLGDGNFTGMSGTTSQTVNQVSTTTTVKSSTNPSVFGQLVTFTATVTAKNLIGAAPTGTVTFMDGSTPLGTVNLNTVGSVTTATLTTTAFELPAESSQTISVKYNGDNNYAVSSTTLSQTVNPDATTTTLTSSGLTSVYGQSVTFTAVVNSNSPGSGVPAGTVSFLEGGAPIGTGTLTFSNGVNSASYSTTALQLPVGADDAIVAVYNPDSSGDYATSQDSLNQTVNQDSTTTKLTASPSTGVYGEPVTFTATISANGPGSGTPSGTVTFMDGSMVLGTGTLSGSGNSAVASFTTGNFQLPVAPNQTITAAYNGDGSFTSSTGTLIETVNPVGTTTSVTTSVTPSVFGQAVVFTATVSSNIAGTGTPGGFVTFIVDGNNNSAETAALNSAGQALFSDSSLSFGMHTITASYDGTSTYGPSSGSVAQTVLVSSLVTVSSSKNPSTFGDSVTFTAHVAPATSGFGAPAGTVTFTIDGAPQGMPVTLSGGVASLTLSNLQIGSRDVVVSYSGDSTYQANTATLTETVLTGTTTTLSATPGTSVYGQQVVLKATVAPVAPGSGTPTGTVAFYIDGGSSPAGTAPVLGGQATFDINTLAVATHTITAVYFGDANYATSSTSSSSTVTVSQVSTSMKLSASSSSDVVGQLVTFTATVTSGSPSTAAPTGSVNFVIGGNTLSSPLFASATPGVAMAVVGYTFFTKGSQSVSASYSANGSFAASNASLNITSQFASTTTLKSSANPVLPGTGHPVTFTATVKGAVSGTGTPTGTVTFLIDGVSTTRTLNSSGVATLTLSSLTIGNHSVTATYNASSSFAGSSASLTQLAQYKTKTSLSAASGSSLVGSDFGFNVTIAPTGGTGKPGGTVTFTIDGVPQTPVSLSNGQAFFDANSLGVSLGVGKHTIKVTYNGDDPSNAYGSSSATFTETVHPLASKLTASYSAPFGFSNQESFSVSIVATNYLGQQAVGFDDPGTVSVVSAPSGATVNGLDGGSFTLSDGIATLSGLSLSKTGKYVLLIEVDNLSFSLTLLNNGRRS